MAITDPDMTFLMALIAEKSGHVISSHQDYLLESRLTPVAKGVGLDNLEALVAELRRRPQGPLHDRVAEAMTINETSFFRDREPFDLLRTTILPELLRRDDPASSVKLWSAACSSGQEPYSIAMTIADHFADTEQGRVRIDASDLCETMVQRTRCGAYSPFEVSRGLTDAELRRHFQRTGASWQIAPEIRGMVDVRKVNLNSFWMAPSQYDVVLLRNVLIYFDHATRIRLLDRIHAVLRPDGYLLLGAGETLTNLDVPFVREQYGTTVCFRSLTD